MAGTQDFKCPYSSYSFPLASFPPYFSKETKTDAQKIGQENAR